MLCELLLERQKRISAFWTRTLRNAGALLGLETQKCRSALDLGAYGILLSKLHL